MSLLGAAVDLQFRLGLVCLLAMGAPPAAIIVPPLIHSVSTIRGLRWQLRPIYVAYGAALLGWEVTGFLLAVFGLAVGWLIPPPVVVGLQGLYSVGFVEYEVQQQEEPPAIGRMFYPAREQHRETAPYMAMGDRHKLSRAFLKIGAPDELKPLLPSFLLQHWVSMPIPAKRAAEPWVPPPEEPALPVIVFSHGLTASRETSTSLALSLAAAGALVLLVEHTDRSSSRARFSDGGTIEYDGSVSALGSNPETAAYKAARRAQADIRVADLERTLAFLVHINRAGPEARNDAVASQKIKLDRVASAASLLDPFRDRLALDSLALGGHSFGGCATLALAAKMLAHQPQGAPGAIDPCISLRACFTLDPAVEWVPEKYWKEIGYAGFQLASSPAGTQQPLTTAAGGGRAPIVPDQLRMLTAFSEQWVQFNWYQTWAADFCRPPSTGGTSHHLVIEGCGHQGLCDLALTLPHALNLHLLKNSLGPPSEALAKAVNTVVVSFLRNEGILRGGTTDLASIPNVISHRAACG